MRLRVLLNMLAATSALSIGLATAASAAQPLVIYAAIGYDEAMGKAFQQATGIPTKVVDMSTGPLLARVEAEKQNPQWDIAWIDGDQGMRTLASEGLLKPFAPKVDWNAIGARLQPEDHAYVVDAASVAGVIVVNNKLLPKAAWPKSWNDLLKPAYRNTVGMNNPAISGPTYSVVAGMMQWQGGVPQGQAWFKKLKANGLHVFDTNDNTLRALGFGQIKVAIVQNSAGIGMKAEGKPFDVVYPTPVTLLPRTIAISAHASPEVQKEAEQFIEFLLSKQGQQVALTGDPNGDSDFNPVIKGVSPNSAVPPLDNVKTQNVDPTVWGPREAKVVSWFTDNIVH